MENRFSPNYAYQTNHPYAQVPAGLTYPGNSIMATTGNQNLKMAGVAALCLAIGGGAGMLLGQRVGKHMEPVADERAGYIMAGLAIGMFGGLMVARQILN